MTRLTGWRGAGRRAALALGLLLAGAGAALAQAPAGESYALPFSVLDGGGGTSDSSSYGAHGSIGQAAGGPSAASESYRADAGFLATYEGMVAQGQADGGTGTGDDGGGGGGGCLIAAAALGSYLEGYLAPLRDFRDRALRTHAPGRALVRAYYALSPPLAGALRRHEPLRTAARWSLTPLVLAVAHPLAAGALAGGLLLGGAGLVGWRRTARRRRRGGAA